MSAKKKSPADALRAVVETLDGLKLNEKQWVLQSAANLWTVLLSSGGGIMAGGTGSGSQTGTGGSTAGEGGLQTPIKQLDAKTFIKSKNPNSETQRVACLAYYLNHARDVAAFKTAEITKLNTEARGPDFNTTRAIDNAARAACGFLSPIGKGQKQLTAFGEEIVEALPSQEAVRALESTRKAGKRGGKGKKGKKTSKAA
jgi:hypothetical protein